MFRFIARNCFSAVRVLNVTLRAMTSNNETVLTQNLRAGNIGKFRMSEGNSALLSTNVDWRRPLQQNLMDYQLQNFQLYKSLKDWILGKQLIKGKRTEFQYGVTEKRINKPAVLIHLNLIISPIICFQYKVGCLYGFIPDFTARGKL